VSIFCGLQRLKNPWNFFLKIWCNKIWKHFCCVSKKFKYNFSDKEKKVWKKFVQTFFPSGKMVFCRLFCHLLERDDLFLQMSNSKNIQLVRQVRFLPNCVCFPRVGGHIVIFMFAIYWTGPCQYKPCCRAGLGNVRPAGHIRPAKHLNVARELYSKFPK